MKVFRSRDGYLVRLERGEEIHAALTRFARDSELRGAVVHGVGAIMDAELGCYRLDRREYARRTLSEVTELLSLVGNLSVLDGAPVLHAHVVLLKPDFTVAGGHLFRGTIAVTGEFSLGQTDLDLVRRPDHEVGLPLLEAGPGYEA